MGYGTPDGKPIPPGDQNARGRGARQGPPPTPEIHKTALGAEDSVEWHYYPSTAEAVADLRTKGFKIVCLEQVKGSVALQDFTPDPSQAYALVVGNEVDGVDPAIVDSADTWLEIPQSGTKHSLNN